MADVVQRRAPQALLFDLDGTLLDSLPGIRHSAMAAFAACGLDVCEDADLRQLIGPPIRGILAQMAARPASEEQLDALVRAFRESYDGEGWRITPHYEGAVETLRMLKEQGRRLFVVSNKPRHISVRILEAEGSLELFEDVVTKDSRQPPYRNKREMMEYLLQKWALTAEECWMVGDTIEDAEAASHSNIRFCLMSHGYGDVPQGSAASVAFRLDHFSELVQVIARERSIDR